MSKQWTPIAMVLDRPTFDKASQSLSTLPGAWGEMCGTWAALSEQFPYVVMLAHTKKRVKFGAPLVMMAANLDHLRAAIEHACSQLSDTKCQWNLLVEQGSGAESITRAVILADTIPEGRA